MKSLAGKKIVLGVSGGIYLTRVYAMSVENIGYALTVA
jgi:NH3-dependent NAD+ synthetase